MDKKRILWITRTGVFCALLIIIQAATSLFANTLITGSLVNLMLITSVLINGLGSGVAVALISPILARLFGIGPLWSLIPCIMLGNLTLILCWHFILGKMRFSMNVSRILALIVGAGLKFAVLYISIVMITIPMFLNLPPQKAAVISATFSVAQFFTATVGGILALIIVPIVKSAIKYEG
ncbi:MAG: hypothetical protein LBU94_06175 [Clostridiales bacterium]|jgi:hypothetical protein|nr:hypothetical protein [Clostridiales bacterium]